MKTNQTIIDLFECISKEKPNHPAIIDCYKEYTYSYLNNQANGVSHFLTQKNVSVGDYIAVFLEPSYEFILCLISIIKCGGVYIPLDTLSPHNRIKNILDDAKPKLIITSKKYLSFFPKSKVNICTIEELMNLEATPYPISLKKPLKPNSPICLMYTSGSTGKPKGVIMPHRAILNIAQDNAFELHANSKMAQFGNLAFDGSTYDIWTTLLNKATLVIITLEERFDSQKLQLAINSNKINHLFLPTGYLHQVVSSHPESLDQVESILFGGEAINTHIINKFIHYRRNKNIPISLINAYGPTETTCYVCRNVITINTPPDEHLSSLGQPILNTELYVLDNNLCPTLEGELYISGAGLAVGYHNSPALTKEKFIHNPFNHSKLYSRMYKTGDLVKKLENGEFTYMGRVDDQVKIGGFRIHLNEIEEELQKHSSIVMASVLVEMGGEQHKILSAYIVFESNNNIVHADEIREFLSQSLPPYMIPIKYNKVEKLPLTVTGKVDKKELHKLPCTDLTFHIDISSDNEIEEAIKEVWKHLLNRPSIEIDKNLFDLGANSLLISEACIQINNKIHSNLNITDILSFPTIQKLAQHIEGHDELSTINKNIYHHKDKVAIVGMSVRLPKAKNITEFWNNLCNGKDCITRFTESNKIKQKNSIGAKGILDDIEYFDDSFFKYNRAEASLTDPQHRIYLECVWEGLEHAGVIPSTDKNKIFSVFSGMTDSTYLYENILKNEKTMQLYDKFQQRIATSIGTLSTQISYRLNLKGQSVNVNTACSTGLITITHACQDLLNGYSDIAIAGASSITVPQLQNYTYTTGSILSPDGYCRPFSDKANGTVFSNGVAVVILKRLKDAIADKDTVYAIIDGYGLNNDGDDKLSYTAPSMNGQIDCIKEALHQANLTPQNIGLIETHGTGTALGDVIEFNALKSVFNDVLEPNSYCALGSAKANIGHTDVTAGVVGLIKAALCIYHQQIPPLIHFQNLNPNLSFEDSPFYINTSLIEWKSKSRRHAGVSSFGVGGTNAHIILSEYKHSNVLSEKTPVTDELIILSAKTEEALNQQIHQYYNYMNSFSSLAEKKISNIAFTLQTGRDNFQWRTFCLGNSVENITKSLQQCKSTDIKLNPSHSIIFLFSGQGSQYAGLCVHLINTIPRFKKYIQEGAKLAHQYLDIDLFTVLQEKNTSLLNQTQYAQPALFIIEYALAQLLIECGVKPTTLMGHSFGEYVAACVAKVFSFEDGIFLSCKRGELMSQTEPGKMIAVNCTVEDTLSYEKHYCIDRALHNTCNQFVFSGKTKHLEQFQSFLDKQKIQYKLLKINHGFHSQLMESIKEPFIALFSKITLSAPTIQMVSNVTGDWLSEHEAKDPEYWYQHLRHTVQYHKGTQLLLNDKHPLFIEIGPGNSLVSLTRQTAAHPIEAIQTLPNEVNAEKDRIYFLNCLGSLWNYGINITFEPLYKGTKRQHIALPTYPFQKNKCWIEPEMMLPSSFEEPSLYQQVWSKQLSYAVLSTLDKSIIEHKDWVIFKDKHGVANQFISLLKANNIYPIIISIDSNSFDQRDNEFHIDGNKKDHYLEIFERIKNTLSNPVVLHCSSLVDANDCNLLEQDKIDSQLTLGFYSILYIAQALTQTYSSQHHQNIWIITNGTIKIQGNETICPPNAAIKGAAMVLMQETPYLTVKIHDVDFKEPILTNNKLHHKILNNSIQNNSNSRNSLLFFYRNNYEWQSKYNKYDSTTSKDSLLKDNGLYLITGGLGGIAQNCCEIITNTVKSPRLILFTRRKVPNESQWESIIKSNANPWYQEIINLIKLKNNGAHVLIYQVDLSEKEMIYKTINNIQNTLGCINGVIHAAGDANPSPFLNKTITSCHNTFLPKLHGTYNLIHALQQTQLDFIVFISSLSSLIGGLGLIDYSAANACLDSFADSNLCSFAKLAQSINWNTWQETGLTNKHIQNQQTYFLTELNEITPYEGQQLFINALKTNENHIAVSKKSFFYSASSIPKRSPQADNLESKQESKELISSNLSTLEKKMMQLWQEALGINQIGLDEDFFSCGGHSLLALSLIERINQSFNCSLHPNQLHETPTINSLLEQIEHNNSNVAHEIIVPLQFHKSSTPYLFLFHPINGLLFCFNTFLLEYDLPMSVFGLQDPSIQKKDMTYSSLREMAEAYLEAILKLQSNGPFFLLGYSFGGNLCYEVASLLQQRGKTVDFIGMIDSWAINTPSSYNKENFNQFLRSINMEENHELSKLAWERQQLLLNHPISSTSQKIILFKAQELLNEYQSINDLTNGWSQYNCDVICYPIPGNHHSIMEKNSIRHIVTILAEYL